MMLGVLVPATTVCSQRSFAPSDVVLLTGRACTRASTGASRTQTCSRKTGFVHSRQPQVDLDLRPEGNCPGQNWRQTANQENEKGGLSAILSPMIPTLVKNGIPILVASTPELKGIKIVALSRCEWVKKRSRRGGRKLIRT